MYYTDITNKELQVFHNIQAHNFSITLTQIITSPLFKVEEVSDNLFRIVPLFYTNKISSTNPSDKILDDKLIIANQGTDETYYTFISDEEAEIKDYTEYGDYYEIGDSLTTAQFNAIVSMLRQNIVNTENIRINDIIHGVYGDYEFDIEDVSIIDTGIVISQDTITAEPKIRLSNNYFKYSTYTLKLTVLKYTGVNIFDTETQDYTEETSIELELTPGTWVDIPVTDLEIGSIILFDGVVEITHDQPVLILPTTLEITSDKDIIQTGDNATITATLYDQKDLPISDESVTFTFLHGETTVETQTAVTDKDGVCSVSYTGKGEGELNIECSCTLLSETYSILDTIFWDIGTIASKNNNWNNYSNRLTVESDTTGTLLTNSKTSNGYYFANGSDPFVFTDYCCEFDVVSINDAVKWYHQNSSNNNKDMFRIDNYYTTGTVHFRLECKDGSLKVYTDDTLRTTVSNTVTGPFEVAFRIDANTSNPRSIKYRNFLIYPI